MTDDKKATLPQIYNVMLIVFSAAMFSFLRTSALSGKTNDPDFVSLKIDVFHCVLPMHAVTPMEPKFFFCWPWNICISAASFLGSVTKCQGVGPA